MLSIYLSNLIMATCVYGKSGSQVVVEQRNKFLIEDITCSLFFSIEFQKISPIEGKWFLTDIADSTQLGSPARLAKKIMIQSSCNKHDTIRNLEQQIEKCLVREEMLQRIAEELQTQVDEANRRAEASNRRAGEFHTQVQGAEDRVQHGF